MTYLADQRRRNRWANTRSVALGDVAVSFPASVETWRSLLEKYRGDIPIDFLLAWIQKESEGDPCSYTSLRESGIFQLMPPDNTNVAGTTETALRSACSGGSGTLTRTLTPAEAELQVSSGIRYVRWAMDQADKKLAAAGASWSRSSPDYWMMVKLAHAYPGYINPWLSGATVMLGRPPNTWKEFRSAITGYAGVLDNAEWTGARSNPSSLGGSLLVPALLVGGAAVLYYLSRR